MNTIKIVTNLVYGGIDPHAYETGVGGSEEKLFELANFLSAQTDSEQAVYDVTIFTNGWHGDLNGVHYRDHREFKPWEHSNIFISFKNRQVLESSINADKILYFTTEIEGKWPQAQLNQVDQVITISKFHTHRMGDAGHPKLKHEYLWADMERMAKNRVAREEGTMLYSSSFDRGLEELLACWDTVKKKMNLKKLYITYGWDFINLIAKDNPNMAKWKERMEKLIEQHKEDIVFLGRVSFDEMCQQYWKCQYWCLPLNNADSELFYRRQLTTL
jgi:hypothetical protein